MGQGTKRSRRGSSINHVPEEILDEILINLPVKSLLRFKSVSKPWRALISSDRFTEDHLHKSSHNFINRKLIYKFKSVDKKNKRSFRTCSLKSLVEGPAYSHFSTIPSLDHGPIRKATKIQGSCNGLILITFDERDLLLWNPSTGLFKNIPPPSYPKPERPRCTDRFEYRRLEYRRERYLYGFGYDGSTRDYKIVYIHTLLSNTLRTEMYSLRSDSWKRIENPEILGYYVPRCYSSSGVLVNGKLHWVGRKGVLSGWDLVRLDLAEEKFEIVGLPRHIIPSYERSWEWRALDLGGYLGMSRIRAMSSRFGSGCGTMWEVDVWVMSKYGEAESWTKVWRRSAECGLRRPPPHGLGVPIWFGENGDVAVWVGDWVHVYDFESKSLKSRVYVPHGHCRGPKCYVESLVSPFGGNQQQLTSL